MDRVQEGFRQVAQVPGGTAAKYFMGEAYSPAPQNRNCRGFLRWST